MTSMPDNSGESKELSPENGNVKKYFIKYIILVILLVALWPSSKLIEIKDRSSEIVWEFILYSTHYILLCASLYYWFKIVFSIHKIKRNRFIYFLFFIIFSTVGFSFVSLTIIGIIFTIFRIS